LAVLGPSGRRKPRGFGVGLDDDRAPGFSCCATTGISRRDRPPDAAPRVPRVLVVPALYRVGGRGGLGQAAVFGSAAFRLSVDWHAGAVSSRAVLSKAGGGQDVFEVEGCLGSNATLYGSTQYPVAASPGRPGTRPGNGVFDAHRRSRFCGPGAHGELCRVAPKPQLFTARAAQMQA